MLSACSSRCRLCCLGHAAAVGSLYEAVFAFTRVNAIKLGIRAEVSLAGQMVLLIRISTCHASAHTHTTRTSSSSTAPFGDTALPLDFHVPCLANAL